MSIVNGYATLTEVKAAARIPTGDTLDDDLLEVSIEAASREIDSYCERVFYQTGSAGTPVARVYIPEDLFVVQTDDIISVTTLKTDSNGDGTFDQTWASSDYQLEPLNGKLAGQAWAYTRIRAAENYLFPVENGLALVKVTGVWGWPAVPQAIEYATIMQSQRLFKRLDSPTGILGFGDMGAVRVTRQLDPDVAEMVNPFRRDGFGIG